MVAHTGFGPVISSLRGTRPRPLDECARTIFYYLLKKASKSSSILEANDRKKEKPASKGGYSKGDWLGKKDSNPRWRSQSPLSYH